MMQEGPFVGSSHEDTQNIIITCATQRVPQCLQFTSNVSESTTSTTCTIHKDNFKELPSQVGGLSSTKECIKLQPPYVLKPLRFHDDRWYRETAFYEAVSIVTATNSTPCPTELTQSYNIWIQSVFAQPTNEIKHDMTEYESVWNEIQILRRLSLFMPKYHGMFISNIHLPDESNRSSSSTISTRSYLVLQDITSGYHQPCTMDIKMGRKAFEPTASQAKQDRERKKYPLQDQYGFRIVGMRVYDPQSSNADKMGYCQYDKHFGRGLLSWSSVINAFSSYLRLDQGDGITSVQRKLISSITHQLRELKDVMRSNRSIALYASSILMAYDATVEEIEKENHDVVALKIIDFTHVWRCTGGNCNDYVQGIDTLLSVFHHLSSD